MSFSFGFRARNVAAALAIAAQEMDRVVQSQPMHEADKASVLAAVQAQVGLIAGAAEGKHVVLSVSGSLGWRGTAAGTAAPASEDFAITSANVSVSAYLMDENAGGTHVPALREAPEA